MKNQTSIDLIHGDCLDVLPNIKRVDLVLTDIPYGVVNRSSNGLRSLDKEKADEMTFNLKDALFSSDERCNGSFYVFCGTEQVSEIRSYYASKGYTTRLCIWQKTNPSPMNGQHCWLSGVECFIYAKKRGGAFNEHCQNTVFKFPTVRGRLHPTMKPVALTERLILASTNEGDTVLDFCMGSGTTGIACLNTGRNFIGIEKDEAYFNIAQERISNHDRK